jgi:hypothetical protein
MRGRLSGSEPVYSLYGIYNFLCYWFGTDSLVAVLRIGKVLMRFRIMCLFDYYQYLFLLFGTVGNSFPDWKGFLCGSGNVSFWLIPVLISLVRYRRYRDSFADRKDLMRIWFMCLFDCGLGLILLCLSREIICPIFYIFLVPKIAVICRPYN